MLADFDERLKTVLCVQERNSREAAFAESPGGRCVDALPLASQTQGNEIILSETGMGADLGD